MSCESTPRPKAKGDGHFGISRFWTRPAGLVLARTGMLSALAIAGPELTLPPAPLPTNPTSTAVTNPVAPPITGTFGREGLRLNLRGAPLKLVLNYLSEAAGFIINPQAEVLGNVEVWSRQPVTQDEAVELLGSVLRNHGYGLTRNGRILTIVALENIKTADTEIAVSRDPGTVEKSVEVQTQVVPVRYATVTQMAANLQPLLPASATLMANEGANSLILVASKTDIKRVLKIVTALDNSLASSATIKVRRLRYAQAKDTATLVTQLFTQPASSQNLQTTSSLGPEPTGGPPGAPFGLFGPGTQNPATIGSNGRGSMASRLTAVADERANALVLSAPPELLSAVEAMIDKLDQPVGDSTELRVFHLTNAEPTELADQLAQLFPDDTSPGSNSDGLPIFFPGGGPGEPNSSSSGATSDRRKKLGKVLAVPDSRTASLIVTAAKSRMPQIAGMIGTLDAVAGKRELVSYFELRNADPQDINQNLQDLFNRNLRMENNNQNSFLGRNHPLTQRQNQNQQGTSSGSTGSGMTGGLGNGLGGSGTRSGQ